MTDWIVLAILVTVVGLAARYVYREKKRGTKCIGCPMAGKCSGTCDENKGM